MKTVTLIKLVAALWATNSAGSKAATFATTTTADSGPGSLRQAILDANALPGLDRIAFSLPGSSPYTIKLSSQLPPITGSVIVDGTTQPGYNGQPLVELSGELAGPNVSGLGILSPGCTIRGLVLNRFSNGSGIEIYSGNNVIQGNYIGTDVTGTLTAINTRAGILIRNGSNNLVGGTNVSAGNLISGNGLTGIEISFGSSRNVVAGNLIGTDVNGTNFLGNRAEGILLGMSAANNTIGGTDPGARNIISGNGLSGIAVQDAATVGNVIEGNFVGTDITGTRPLGNGEDGIRILGARNTRIGGSAPNARNLISGNGRFGRPNSGRSGIEVWASAAGTLIQGNFVGTDVTGIENLGNREYGVFIQNSSQNTVGGNAPGAGNLIAHNQSAGVFVESGTNNLIRGNALWANGGLGIDLGSTGTTPNDPGDADVEANQLQNAPLLDSAGVNADGSLTIRGALNSRPDTEFSLEFFSNQDCDPSGAGEGQTWIGATNLTTGADGIATFIVLVSSAVPIGYSITATATDAANNTSEFSPCIKVVGSSPPDIVEQPQNQTAVVGGNAGFTVRVAESATLPISYQWFWNGNSSVTQRFLNASISVTDHTCTLVLSNVPSNQAGSYNVSVSNVAGLVESISALLTVLADTDGDRIPDEWEIAYGLRPDDPTDATADSDQDGLTNLDEYRAGTNPTDALSLLKIDMVQLVGPGLDRLVLRFSTVANKTYSIQHATSLGVGSWTNLVNLEAEASDRVVAITNPIPTGSSLGHFRLVIPRQP